MERLKRLFYLTIFNVLVAATTTLAVLYAWDLGKERLIEMQRVAGQTSVAPAITIVVINAASEGTAVVETLGIPTQTPGTPTPVTPTPPSEVYHVQEGDTLSIIADRFDVTLFDILAINDLADPNNLFVGQEVFIPTGPLPTLTPSFTPSATATSSTTPTPRQAQLSSPTPSPSPGKVEVVIESILGIGDLNTERVRIILRGDGDISMAGWRLSDSNGNVYLFPQLDLFAGGWVQVNSRAGLNTANDLYWGMSEPVWQSGESALLMDAQGNRQAEFQIP